jgi:hypothetical protein
MFIRLLILSLLTLALARPALAQQEPAPAYPPGTYQPQPQPAPYPQPQPAPYPQQPMQQEPYPPDGYPSPLAADPNAPYAPGAYPPGYVYGAQEPLLSSVEGALQLSLGTYFMRYTSASTDYDNAGLSDESVSELLWGLSERSTVTLEGGYGVMERLLIGGVLQLGGTSGTRDPDVDGVPELETSSFDLLIGPKAEFHFLPTSKFNPYAGAVLAVASHSEEQGELSSSYLMFNLQIRGGIRCFITDSLSIDPSLVFAFAFGGGSLEAPMIESDLSISGFRIGLALNVSGWLR